MVSNQELKQRLKEKKSISKKTGYLVCDSCHGSYELQDGENPEDYSSQCECGGKLNYNQKITPDDTKKDTALTKIIIGGAVFFAVFLVLAFLVYPIVMLDYMGSQSSINNNIGSGTSYDQLNNLTTSYDSLENQYQVLGTRIHKTNNTNLKSAYANAQLQLEDTNITINNVNSALTSGLPNSEVNKRINTAQNQLLIAKKSLNNVTSMI
jgi:hypothetical protein